MIIHTFILNFLISEVYKLFLILMDKVSKITSFSSYVNSSCSKKHVNINLYRNSYMTINSKTTFSTSILYIFDLKFHACYNLQKDTNYKSF